VALAHRALAACVSFLLINPIYVFFIFVCWPTYVLKRVALSQCRGPRHVTTIPRDAIVETKRTVHVLICFGQGFHKCSGLGLYRSSTRFSPDVGTVHVTWSLCDDSFSGLTVSRCERFRFYERSSPLSLMNGDSIIIRTRHTRASTLTHSLTTLVVQR
jgi:hypothetical protein